MRNNFSTLTAKIAFRTSFQNHYTDFSKYFYTFRKNNLTFLFGNNIMRIFDGVRIGKAPRSIERGALCLLMDMRYPWVSRIEFSLQQTQITVVDLTITV